MKLKNLSIILIFTMIITATVPFTAFAAKWDPYEKIIAGQFDEKYDTNGVINSSNGGTTFGYTQKNYLVYKNINFTDAPYGAAVSIGIGSEYLYNNVVWLRLDSPTAEPFATIYVTETNGWAVSEAVEHIGTITQSITGKHDVYVSSSQPNNFFYFYFLAKRKGELTYKPYEEINAFSDTKGSKYEKEIEVMNGLGVVSEYKNGQFYPDLPIVRGEFASWMAHFMTDEIPAGTDNPFSDISDYEYMSEICYLYDNGLLKLNEDKTFNPYDFITVREASAIILRYLNYETMIEYKGGWPYGYDSIARDIGITDGMAANDYLRRAPAAKMLYNTIDAEYLSVGGIKNDNITFDKKKGILEETRDLYKATGIVTATSYGGISGEVTLPYSGCNIGTQTYTLAENVSVEHYLGVKCEYYYYSKDGGSTKEIAFITPASKTTMLTLDSKNVEFEKITDELITYRDENDKEKNIKINSANWIYNNQALTIDIRGVIRNPSGFGGKIRLVDNGSGWETVWVDNYKNIKIQSYSVNTNTLTDELSGDSWCFEGKTFLVSDGKQTVKPKNLKRGQLAELYLSYDKEFAVLLVGESTVTGEATELTSDGKVIIGTTEYKCAKEFKDEILLGTTTDFYISRNGEIVYVKTGSASKSYGLLSEVRKEKDDTYITIVTATEEEKEFKTASKIYVDGVRMKEYGEISTQLKAAGQYCPVLYNVNASNELTMIDTPVDGAKNENDTLTKLSVDTSVKYLPKPSLLRMNPENTDKPIVPIRKSTVLVTGRQYGVSGIDYSFTTVNGATGWHQKYDAFYSFERDSKIADLIFISYFTTYSHGGYVVFNGYTSSVDEYGNKGVKANFVSSSGEVSYFVVNDNAAIVSKIKAMEKGDIAEMGFGFYKDVYYLNFTAFNDGEATRGSYSATISKDRGFSNNSNGDYTFVLGTVTKILDEFVVVKPFNYSEEVYMNINEQQVITVNNDGTINNSMSSNNIKVGDRIFAHNESTWKSIVVYEQ